MKKLLLGFVALLTVATAVAQNSFSYQAVIRDDGKVLENKTVSLRLSVMLADSVYYKEVHQTTTNAYGNVNVNVGEGTGLQGSFTAIPWETMRVMMQVEVSTDGSTYTNMGALQIQPVPYTMYAPRTTTVIQPKEATDEPIFQIKDNDGNMLFAVYETGVKVFVDYDDDSKAAKAKFAVSSIRRNKGEEDLLTVDNQGATIYVEDDDNQNDKAAKAKFAVSSIRRNKGDENLLTIDNQGATIYVDDDSQNGKAAKAKFAVSSIRRNKGEENLMTVDGQGATIYVDDNQSGKAAKAKFAVSSIRRNKSEENLFTIDGDGSTVYVDFNTTDKAAKAKFAVAGRSGKGDDDVLNVDGDQATFYIDLDENESDKAAKSTFAVASVRRGKTEPEPYFIIDRFGSLVYIDDDSENGKAAKAKFAVAGRSGKGTDNFLTVDADSARIYVNDNATGRSNFAIIDALRNLEMMMVNRDSTLINMDSYINVLQTASGKISSMYACKLTVTMPDGAGVISAIYNNDGTPIVFEKSAPGVFVADAIKGQKITLTATPGEGYDFRGWKVGESTSSGSYSIESLSGDMSLTALFSQSVLYVSEEGQEGNAGNMIDVALPSIESAIARINNSPTKDDWTIYVVGELKGAQYLGYDYDAGIDINATSITLKGKNGGTLKGAYNPELGVPETDDDIYSVLDICTEVPVTIEDLTISNGYSYSGGGLYVDEYSTVTIGNGTVITNNMAEEYGGGVYVYEDAALIIEGSATITGNSAPYGGGIYITKDGEVQMQDGEISNNTAIDGGNCGGGVFVVGTMAMSGGLISGNEAKYNSDMPYNGHGVYLGYYIDDYRYYATFTMSGFAKVAADNDVYLPKEYSSATTNAKISIAGNLAFDTAAVITPEYYTIAALTNAGDIDYVANNCGRFVVTPEYSGGEYRDYFVDAGGEIRRFMELVEVDSFKYYLSDIANREGFEWNDETEELEASISNEYGENYYLEADEYSYKYFCIGCIGYEDDGGTTHSHDNSFSRLATINEEGLLLPCKSDGIILLNSNSQETASGEGAVVMIKYYYDGDDYQFSLWPMASLTDYKMTFALINEDWDGNATQYERYDFVINCEKAYPGCQLSPIAYYNDGNYDKYDVKITTAEGTETVSVEDMYTDFTASAAFGSIVTLEALTAPEGMMFDYWLKKEYYSSSYGVPYYANPLQVRMSDVNKVYFEAHFKEIPPILVDGDDGDDETADGYNIPFKTLTGALRFIETKNNDSETYKIKVSNYTDDIAVGSSIDGKASTLTIDFGENGQYEGTTTAQHVIDINTTVPITISNLQMSRVSADRVINVPAGKTLTLDNCTISGGTEDNLASVGGAYIGEGGQLTLKASAIQYFSAGNGGGVYVDGGELILDGTYSVNSFVRYCKTTGTGSTKGMGGGVYATNGGKLTFKEYAYVSNNEAKNGGGVYLTDNATMEFVEQYYSYINDNKATTNGGGLFLDEGLSLTLGNYNYIESNTAQYGGGVFVSEGASLTSNGVYVRQNTSSKNGGGVYVAGALTANSGTYIGYWNQGTGNTSATGGGVYVADGGTYTMNGDSYMYYNGSDKATSTGGAVYVDVNGKFTMNNGYIDSNTAVSGSGVYVEADGQFDFLGGSIYRNKKPNNDDVSALGTGVYVTNGATFNIGGSMNMGGSGADGNNVYLDGDASSIAKINLTSALTSDYYQVLATIQLATANYKANRQVVTSNGFSGSYGKIAVEKQMVTNTFGAIMPVEWTIDSEGKLQKAAVDDGNTTEGAICGEFKVSDTKTVQFSKGNLQYQASSGTWQFASNQTDYVSTTNNEKLSAESDIWFDLFGYGTSGWNSGAAEHQPYSHGFDGNDYLQGNLTGSNANADWGVYNAISNGGNTHGMWRTLTEEEWQYLFFGRGTETDSKKKFAKAKVTIDGHTSYGVIILPDNWKVTTADMNAKGITNFLTGEGPSNGTQTGYDVNQLNASQWEFMENNGAVFLPAGSYREASYSGGANPEPISVYVPATTSGYYWTANGSVVAFGSNTLELSSSFDKWKGANVRLVADVSGGDDSKHQKVDLHLPSGKQWAKINLGFDEIYKMQNGSTLNESEAYCYSNSYVKGSSDIAHGNRYAWGDPEAKTSFGVGNYKHYNNGYTKYNDDDELNVLDLEDDPAYVAWGGNWRTPTDEDWKELFENCYWAVNKVNNVYKAWEVYLPKKTADINRHYNGYDGWGCYVPEGWSNSSCGYTSGSSGAAYRPTGSYGYSSTETKIVIPMQTGYMYNNYACYYTSVLNGTGSSAKPYFIKLGSGRYDNESYNAIRKSDNDRYYGYYIRPIWVPITTTVFYVSPSGDDSNDGSRTKPFATIQKAASAMKDKYTRYTIFVEGELTTDQTLTGSIKARSITLRGAKGLDNSTGLPKDKISGGITINCTVTSGNNEKPLPVTIENLEITEGLTVGTNGKVTISGGSVIQGNTGPDVTVLGTFGMNRDALVDKVSLAEGKTITVGKLTTENTTTISLLSAEQYAPETQVLVKEAGVEELPVSKFVMDDGANWEIDEDGKLKIAD